MLQVAWLVLANQNALFHSNYAMLKFVCDFTSRVKCTEPGFKWIQMSFYKFKLSICRYKIWSDSRKVYNEITTWMNCSPKRLRFGDPFSSFRAQKPSAKYKMILNIFLQKLCSKQFVHLLACLLPVCWLCGNILFYIFYIILSSSLYLSVFSLQTNTPPTTKYKHQND